MTTIAYKDHILAADTSISLDSGDFEGTAAKLARSPAGSLAGAAGAASCCALFLALTASGQVDNWLDQGQREGGVLRPLDLPLPLDLHLGPSGFGALYVHYSGLVYAISATLLPYSYAAPFYAEGSGHEYAKGAMSAGASAEEAVRIAARWDRRTNEEVQTLIFKGLRC